VRSLIYRFCLSRTNIEYPSNVMVHRLGEYTSIQKRMRASPLAKIREYLSFLLQTRRLLQDVSLIYAYDAFAYIATYLCRLSLPQTILLIYQNHEIEEHLAGLFSLSGWVQRAERAWIHQADLVVFPDRDRLLKEQNLDPNKISILPNTFDHHLWEISEKPAYLLKRHQLQSQQPIILTVSRLSRDDPYKGYNKILDALPQIRASIPNIHYIIVGKGDDLPRLQEFIDRNQLQDCVTLAGFIPESQLKDYYRQFLSKIAT
jgi:glycosyltransferase involved in cell wall biosynthesis